jgi:hypothetical protein
MRVALGTYAVSALTSYVMRELIAPSRNVVVKNEQGEDVINVKPYTFALTAEELRRIDNNPEVGHILRTAKRRDALFGKQLPGDA